MCKPLVNQPIKNDTQHLHRLQIIINPRINHFQFLASLRQIIKNKNVGKLREQPDTPINQNILILSLINHITNINCYKQYYIVIKLLLQLLPL